MLHSNKKAFAILFLLVSTMLFSTLSFIPNAKATGTVEVILGGDTYTSWHGLDPVYIPSGTYVTFPCTASGGYVIDGFSFLSSSSYVIDQTGIGTASATLYAYVDSYCWIYAYIATPSTTVTPSHDAHSTISPDSPQTLAYGESIEFTYSADPDYILSVTVNGIPIDIGAHPSSYTVNYAASDQTIAVTATYNQAISVLKLPFDRETGNTAYDWSNYYNNGAITGATRSYSGYYGMCLSFGGSDYVTVVDDNSLDLTAGVLLSAWIYPTSINQAVIIDKPNTYGLYLTTSGGISFKVNDQYFNTSSSLITANNWYHIVAKYDGANCYVYINNALSKSAAYSSAIIPSAFDLVVGSEFVGNLDEIIVAGKDFTGYNSVISTYPYPYNSIINANDYLEISQIYNFTSIYIRQNSSLPLTYVKFNFTDGTSQLGLDYTVASNTYGTYTGAGGGGSAKITFISMNYATSSNSATLYSSISIENNIQSTVNASINLYCEDALSSGSLTLPNIFTIYGAGGLVTYVFAGDGSSISGGSLLDIMATNSSLLGGGSYAKAEMLVSNLQHTGMLVHIYQNTVWDGTEWVEPSLNHDTAWFAFGVNYLDNATWTDGWYVNITVPDGAADANNGWVRLNCSWYNAGAIVKSDTVYAMYEAYTENDTTTQFTLWIDFWLSNLAGNSMVGGHVSSMYYGMEHTGWWLWSNWGPVGGLVSSSTFTDYLYDANGNVTTASDLSVFHVWDEMAKVAPGVDGSSDACTWAIQVESLSLETAANNVALSGINTPVFQPTTTPDMPVGFFAQLSNMLSGAMNTISAGISTFVQGGTALGASAIDSAFSAVGVNDFVPSVTGFLGGIASYFATSVTYIIDILTTFFTLLANIASFIIEWFGAFIDILIQIGTIVSGIITGTGDITSGMGNLLNIIPIGSLLASGFIPILLAVWWFDSIDKRAKQYGGGWMSFFMSDIQNILSVFSFILDLGWRVVTTVIDLTMRFINIFIPA